MQYQRAALHHAKHPRAAPAAAREPCRPRLPTPRGTALRSRLGRSPAAPGKGRPLVDAVRNDRPESVSASVWVVQVSEAIPVEPVAVCFVRHDLWWVSRQVPCHAIELSVCPNGRLRGLGERFSQRLHHDVLLSIGLGPGATRSERSGGRRERCLDQRTCAPDRPRGPQRATAPRSRSMPPETKSWPCESNPVRLSSYVSRAIARWEVAGFRPGFWQQGQSNPCYSSAQPPLLRADLRA